MEVGTSFVTFSTKFTRYYDYEAFDIHMSYDQDFYLTKTRNFRKLFFR